MYVSSLKLAFRLIKVEKKLVDCSVKPCFLNNLSAILNAQNRTRFRKYNFGRNKPCFMGLQTVQVQEKYKPEVQGYEKRGTGKVPVPPVKWAIFLLEVTLQQTLQCLAVTGFCGE